MFIPIQSEGSLNVHLINTDYIVDIILSMRAHEKQVAIIKMNDGTSYTTCKVELLKKLKQTHQVEALEDEIEEFRKNR
jgi:uncharacterized protein YjhX (UPF0386 family)